MAGVLLNIDWRSLLGRDASPATEPELEPVFEPVFEPVEEPALEPVLEEPVSVPTPEIATPEIIAPEVEVNFEPLHPYHPLGVTIPGYASNEASVPVLLASLSGMVVFALLGASAIALRVNPKLTKTNLIRFCWFILRYFVFNHATVASSQNVFAQLWKEYALSDSRYLTSDFFILSIESLTMFILGPLCFANAVAIVRGSPTRHALRIVACIAHLYGVALYYVTSLSEIYFTGRSHSRPEALYFWVYFVGFNLPWAIIPAVLLYDSVRTITAAIGALEKVDVTLNAYHRRQGGVNGVSEPKKTR
ncbi:3-beta-hydroxysteroid-Delta(8),Delta(7)-isomerase [Daldinia childiae]|uniref:3-beta-hydroxysteroid-Delta(8), Delta(7)-isomerase n=1 Tax=Daldinia childiae TaxID=326645 RepID=UPI0014452D45|nr:3-beta-hydroxysteroid-Delta(8),Delta(7)-isomerase [Daldinia childiae]KAF3064080.1 3-beta-hydroxysteroid-Delta(8),Delta(7)-isomerase [Daldinia childiae]